ncbi:DUF3488 and transglutaminase-like domain-containing protein [Frankia sp. R43]|uniref:DUF3488 and transglutaminase-like domain-containing protein n=1 Tax=Frankia sp. R43 TaxID=269536 RepID=UPI000ADCFB73|nr:DUF3488 and transglutaminase-like domain-containing protein [Frankia sp. R43]
MKDLTVEPPAVRPPAGPAPSAAVSAGVPSAGPAAVSAGVASAGAAATSTTSDAAHAEETPPGAARRAVELAFVAALALVGGSGFTRLFPARDLWVPLPVAAVLPVVLVALLGGPRRGRRPAPAVLTVPAWMVGFVVWTGYTVAAEAGGFLARLELVRVGVIDGWARLLDVAAPAPADPDLLIVALAPTWLAAAIGAELTIRTRAALLPVLPAVVTLLAATALALPVPGDNLPQTGVLVALAAGHLLARMPRTGGYGLARSSARGLVATLTVLLVGILAAVTVTGGRLGDPVDPRDHRSTTPVDVTETSPLAALSGWTAHPDDVLFRAAVTGPDPAAPVIFRLAVFDDYDGVSWRSTARFVAAGATIVPPGTAAAQPRQDPSVRQEVEVVGLGGNLLPANGSPLSGPPGVRVDPGTGMLRSDLPLAAGSRFEITSVPEPRPEPAQIAALSAGAAAADHDDSDLAVPADPPSILRSMAELATARGRTPFERAALLGSYLSANFVFDPEVPPGHAYGHIDHFLGHTRRGTSEQFATAFVLAARLLGLPARLAVGFTAPASAPAASGDGAGAADQIRTVHGSDALAWAEVRFDGVGWLPFFPTPRSAEARGASVAGSNQGETPEQAELIEVALRSVAAGEATPATKPAAPMTAGGDGGPDGGPSAPSDGAGAWWKHVVLGVLILVGLAGLYLAVALAASGVRRRRLRFAAQRRERVVGAWQCALEALAEAGCTVPAAASPVQVVHLGGTFAAAAQAGPAVEAALRGLADLVTIAIFAPDTALDWDGAAGARAAEEAWRQLDRAERALRGRGPRGRNRPRGLRNPRSPEEARNPEEPRNRRFHRLRRVRRLRRLLAPGTVWSRLRGPRDHGNPPDSPYGSASSAADGRPDAETTGAADRDSLASVA